MTWWTNYEVTVTLGWLDSQSSGKHHIIVMVMKLGKVCLINVILNGDLCKIFHVFINKIMLCVVTGWLYCWWDITNSFCSGITLRSQGHRRSKYLITAYFLFNCVFFYNSLYTGSPLTCTFANIEDPDKMPYDVAFYQGLHCLILWK